LVLFFDDLVANPADLFTRTCRWLEIDPVALPADGMGSDNATVDYRSPAVQRAAARLAKLARPVLVRSPGLAARARRAYGAVNEKPAAPGDVSAETSAALREHYRASMTALRELLTGRGVTDVPDWLDPT
jgi:hypothetical protein